MYYTCSKGVKTPISISDSLLNDYSTQIISCKNKREFFELTGIELAPNVIEDTGKTVILNDTKAIYDTNVTKFGSAININSSWLTITPQITFGGDDFCFECWGWILSFWQFASFISTQSTVLAGAASRQGQIEFGLFPNQSFYLGLYDVDGNGGDHLQLGNVPDMLNNLHHYAMTYEHDKKLIKIWVDGQAVHTESDVTIEKLPRYVWCGNNSFNLGDYPMRAYLDEIRVSDTIRYTDSFTPPNERFTKDDNTLLLIHCMD